MADPLVEAFATPPTAPERWQRGIAGAIVGTRVGARKVMEEIAADDWAISPYRRWLAGLVGGDMGDYELNLRKAESEMSNQKSKISEYEELLKKGEAVLPAINAGEYLKRTIRSGETAGQIALDIAKRLDVSLTDEQKKRLPAKISIGNKISEDEGFAKVIMEVVNIANKKRAGKSIETELQEAENKFTSARSKYNKSIRKFNERISKKTELEKMLRLKFKIDPRRRYGQREDTTELRRRLDIKDEINKSITFLEKNYSDIPIKTRTEGGKETEVALVRFLPAIKSMADRITDIGISSTEAERFAKNAYGALSEISDINIETKQKKGLLIGDLFRLIKFKDPLIEEKLMVTEIPYKRTKEVYGFEPLAKKIKTAEELTEELRKRAAKR